MRYVIEKRNRENGKWYPVKVFLKRKLAEKYFKSKNKLDFRIFGE